MVEVTTETLCAHCDEREATCVGRYEGATDESPACDACCGHGCEDGHCRPIATPDAARPSSQ